MNLVLDSSTPEPQPSAATTPVNVTLSTFKKEVLDASMQAIILADFWAPWCEPCKQLGPTLEKIVGQTQGAVKLAKINIDENPQIAQQMRIQSIPAVFAFWKGQPVDGFMGALPESQIKTWIAQLVQVTGAKGGTAQDDLASGLVQAETALSQGDATTAHAIYADLMTEHPDNPDIHAGYVRALVALGQLDEAKDHLASLADVLVLHAKVSAAKAALDLALQTQQGDTVSLDSYQAALSENPNNHQARFALALAHYGRGDTREALTQLLEIVRRDRKWNNDGARVQMLKIFEALGPMHEHTIEARKQLSALLFS